jgi:enamine deaminase RidA (YjgF/YER057c/UK114 family)
MREDRPMDPEVKLAELGLELPAAPRPLANYVPAARAGDLLFLAGHGPMRSDGTPVTGKVGGSLDVEQGKEAARLTTLGLLSTLRTELGSLDHVVQIVKVVGMVNCAPGFTDIPTVINGCSDLLVEVFGERGKHARSAVGMAELPFDIAVEIDLIARVRA